MEVLCKAGGLKEPEHREIIRSGLRFCESGAEAIAGEARKKQEAPVAHESHRRKAVNI